MTTVGVLCARVRVEEKQLLAALAEAGVVSAPLAPAAVPLPVGPPPPTPTPPGADGFAPFGAPATGLIIDRCQDRTVAGAILRVCRSLGVATFDAGLAATGDRLAVAGALAAAGIPRPETRLASGEAAGLIAVADFGYPSTVLPLAAGSSAVALPDRDTAEAVLEHRSVLGSAGSALALVQAGAVDPTARWTVVVVAGRVVAAIPADGGRPLPGAGFEAAEAAARVLAAGAVGVEIAGVAGALVVWDVHPVPEFRHAAPLARENVAVAIAAAAIGHTPRAAVDPAVDEARPTAPLAAEAAVWSTAQATREVRDGVPLFA